MTFLEPALLALLPLAALPVVIHLIHQMRRKPVPWAAMMFLLRAQRMDRGLSRLRQILILACRVLAVAGILFVVTRPLAGGWLGLTGGAPDTVLILLDRSASMEQHPPTAPASKRQAGLRNLAKALRDTVGTRSRLFLLESATPEPVTLERPESLTDIPATSATDTRADIPALLQSALDFITTNRSGRTDVWLLSDLQRSDWARQDGRWDALRKAFAGLNAVRFHLLSYPETPTADAGIRITRIHRTATASKAELLLDLELSQSSSETSSNNTVDLRVVVNGVTSTRQLTINDRQTSVRGFSIPIDVAAKRGWGRLELPADSNPANNLFHFVYDEAPTLRSVVLTDDDAVAEPLVAVLSASADESRNYACDRLPSKRAHEIPWDETALIVWHATPPKPDSPLHRQLLTHIRNGRRLLFLPLADASSPSFAGLAWGKPTALDQPLSPATWRNDHDLLANTKDGSALPVGDLEVRKFTSVQGNGIPLAQLPNNQTILQRSATENGVYFLGVLPSPGDSSLASQGVSLFVLLHRALEDGSRSLGKARLLDAAHSALPAEAGLWRNADPSAESPNPSNPGLQAGSFAAGDLLHALNRPESEDLAESLDRSAVEELFAGLDFRMITDSTENGRDITSEVWRSFLALMAIALLAEAVLCMPPAPATNPIQPSRANAQPAPRS
jgi:hypothetical protein